MENKQKISVVNYFPVGLIIVVEYKPENKYLKRERIAFYCESGDEGKAVYVAKSYGVLFAKLNGYNDTDAQTIVRDCLPDSSAKLHEYDRNLFTEYWGKSKVDYWYWNKKEFNTYRAKYRRGTLSNLMKFV